MSERLAPAIERWLADGEAVALVTIAVAKGSTPRTAGTAMAVTAAAIQGTIGGGRLEWEAIRRARALLDSGAAEDRFDIPLGPAVGQCCGGRVELALQRVDDGLLAELRAAEAVAAGAAPQVLVFGAGHVGQALVRALVPLPVRMLWVDARPGVFLAEAAETVMQEAGDPLEALRGAAPGAAAVVLTHSHALDYEITEAALARPDLAYVGLIGSATKRRRFERWFLARGGAEAALARLVCPIGDFGVIDKRPSVIAAFAAAEILRALAKGQAVERTADSEPTGEERG